MGAALETEEVVIAAAAAAGAGDPESFADRYTALVEGTLILRQVHGRDDAARVIKPAVEAMIREEFSVHEPDSPV